MAKYNLIRNGYIETVTSSGTGNMAFSGEELKVLYDDNTTSSGILMTSTDTLYIDIDLRERILLDEVAVYMDIEGDRLTALSNMSFYHKDTIADEYILADKAVDLEKFFLNITSSGFAPRYIRLIITNINGTLNELRVFNEDYIVAFGTDGSQIEKRLDEDAEYDTIYLYNKDTEVVDAYVAADFEDGDLAPYIKLSSGPEGPYTGAMDSGIGIDAMQNSKYQWYMGTFDSTVIENNSLMLPEFNDPAVSSLAYRTTTMPFGQSAWKGWGVGFDAWELTKDYDIYAIGRTNNTNNLKLFKYPYGGDAWELVDDIITPKLPGGWTCMSVVGDYVYMLIDLSGYFGRYDLNGPPGNWERLTDCPHGTITKAAQGMCSDKDRYIYSAMITYSSSTKSFQRYDTVNATWSGLSDGYSQNNNTSYEYASRVSLEYDTDREVIYLECGEYSWGDRDIQRYKVLTDTWEVHWLDQSADPRARGMSYFDNYFVWGGYGYGNYIYSRDIRSNTSVSIKLPFNQTSASFESQRMYLMCYPRKDGLIGVMVTGGPYNVIYEYTLGRSTFLPCTGYYTTPIFSMTDKNIPSFLSIDYAETDNAKLTYGGFGDSATIKLRGSNTEPRPFSKLYMTYEPSSTTFKLIEGDLITGAMDTSKFSIPMSTSYTNYKRIMRIMHSPYENNLIFYVWDTYSTHEGMFMNYDLSSNNVKYQSSVSTTYLANSSHSHTRHMDVDLFGQVWYYNGSTLRRMYYELNGVAMSKTNSTSDFLHSLSCSRSISACWYSDKAEKKLKQISSSGTELCAVPITNPTFVSAANDGGCFVFDDASSRIYKYSRFGVEALSFYVPESYNIVNMIADRSPSLNESIWILDANNVLLRMDTAGKVVAQAEVPYATQMDVHREGCLVYSSIKVTYQIDRDCNIIKSWDLNGYGSQALLACALNVDYNNLLQAKSSDLTKYIEDPEWGPEVDNWIEFPLSDKTLENKKYYQAEFKFTSSEETESAVVKNIFIAEALRINDIHPNNSKPVYVKTEFPVSVENKDYETSLRCWWVRKDD